jgi:general secretion pathway protein M
VKEWLDKLEPRERAVLLFGAVAAIAIVFFAFVWRPLTEGTSTLHSSIESKERVLTYLYRAEGLLTGDNDDRPAPAARSLVVLIDQTAQASGLGGAVTRTRPDGATRINISFENAPFDNLLAWLISLQQNEGVYVEGASINDTRERGRVSGQLLLSRP